jgi:Fic family protein
MDDLVAFTGRTDVHPLILAAIAHAQFETIHPFVDGNGRVGRALIQVILHGSGLIRRASLPVSAGLLSNIKAYHRALDLYRKGNCAPIIQQLCESIGLAMEASWNTANRIEALENRWRTALHVRKDSAMWHMLPLLFDQPVVTAAYLKEHLGVTDTAVRNIIETATNAGILKRLNNQRRHVMYQAPEVCLIMDDFAKGIARRRH